MKNNKRVVCKDGFSMSVQAARGKYCCPRMDNAERYIEVEVGFPSEPEDLIIKYAEDPDQPCDTVYGYVPSHLITLVITKHGGMVDGEVPKGVPVSYPFGQNMSLTE